MKLVGLTQCAGNVLQHDQTKKIRITIEGYVSELRNNMVSILGYGPDGTPTTTFNGNSLDLQFTKEKVTVDWLEETK
jgi:hypothetical protein